MLSILSWGAHDVIKGFTYPDFKPCIRRAHADITGTDHVHSSPDTPWMYSCYHRLWAFLNYKEGLLKVKDKLSQEMSLPRRIIAWIVHDITCHVHEIKALEIKKNNNKNSHFSHFLALKEACSKNMLWKMTASSPLPFAVCCSYDGPWCLISLQIPPVPC